MATALNPRLTKQALRCEGERFSTLDVADSIPLTGKLCFEGSEDSEIYPNMIAVRHGDRSDAGAGRYDVAGKQTTGVPAELIRNPRQCDKRVSENIGAAAAGNAFTVSIAVSLVSCVRSTARQLATVGWPKINQHAQALSAINCGAPTRV